jgi:hypothetical protein
MNPNMMLLALMGVIGIIILVLLMNNKSENKEKMDHKVVQENKTEMANIPLDISGDENKSIFYDYKKGHGSLTKDKFTYPMKTNKKPYGNTTTYYKSPPNSIEIDNSPKLGQAKSGAYAQGSTKFVKQSKQMQGNITEIDPSKFKRAGDAEVEAEDLLMA